MIGIRISDSERAKDIVLLDYFNFYITMTNTLYNYYLWLHVQYNSFVISSLKVQQSPCVKGPCARLVFGHASIDNSMSDVESFVNRSFICSFSYEYLSI